jgi:hypothetical protein
MFLVSVKSGNSLLLKFSIDDGIDGWELVTTHAWQYFGEINILAPLAPLLFICSARKTQHVL